MRVAGQATCGDKLTALSCYLPGLGSLSSWQAEVLAGCRPLSKLAGSQPAPDPFPSTDAVSSESDARASKSSRQANCGDDRLFFPSLPPKKLGLLGGILQNDARLQVA
jgi:hypothetical protein